jgi:hypothetical protein
MGDSAARVAGVGALVLAVLGLGAPAGAATEPVVVTAPGAVTVPVGTTSSVPGAAVTGFDAAEPVRAVVSVDSGVLSFPDSLVGLTVPFGYPPLGANGPQVAVEGTEDPLNTALSQLRWTPSSPGPTQLTVDASPAGAVHSLDNGHYYQVVTTPGPTTWDEARAAAGASTFNGYQGYLATITTPAEEDALERTTADSAWIGASTVSPVTWQWATGPEAGSPLTFTMWAANQPDGAPGHDVTVFDGSTGLWRATAVDDPTVTGFLVEYGGGPGETAAQEGQANTTLSAIAPPGAPSGVQAEPGTEAVTVSWQPPASDGGTLPTAYVVTGTPSGSCLATAPALSCVVGGLVAGTMYQFRVAALNDAGASPWSDPSAPVVLGFGSPTPMTDPPFGDTTAPPPPDTTPPPSPETTAPPSPETTEAPPPDMTDVPSPDTTEPSALGSPTTVAVTAKSGTSTPSTTTTSSTSASTASAASTAPSTTATSGVAASGAGRASVYIVFDVGVGAKLSDARLTVRGVGLRSGSSFTVTAHSTPVVLASVDVGATGVVRWDGTLPPDLADGEHTIDVLATSADGTAVGRVASFAVGDGVLTRIGAAVPDSATSASIAGAPPTTVADRATSASKSTDSGADSGGSSGGSRQWLLLLGLTAAAGGAGAVWRRRKRAGQSAGTPAVTEDPTTEEASRPRTRTAPRRRARSRRRPAAAQAGTPR